MTKQATDLDHIAEDIALENAIAKSSTPSPEVPPVSAQPVPMPQAAWQTLERLQLAAQASQQQLQVFVDGLALGQGVPQGAHLTQMPQGGWVWVVNEQAAQAPQG